jgi:hypothetical protein
VKLWFLGFGIEAPLIDEHSLLPQAELPKPPVSSPPSSAIRRIARPARLGATFPEIGVDNFKDLIISERGASLTHFELAQ